MVNYLGEYTLHGSYGYWGKDKTLDIQTPIEEVFDPPNISWGSAFRVPNTKKHQQLHE